ncbi:hypothetical protein P3X46_002151 [Hevea brasiliensis]|uniref:Transcription repressor n=1 Tax=Hevea brasiliensis TaxID=3981 RepID=A0ABQ9N220_HEVBR|nr:transcription repressor OFP7-like [Hevea brasiliensis]KAJ9186602.1 hypothetical protein P3X46_002151 [Hevea brasiliensis]
MSKRFKLKLSRVIPSFQICRSKNASEIPIPAIYRVSPFNRKVLGINYPKLPDPPPSTPDYKRHVSQKKASAACRRQSRSLAYYLADYSLESVDFAQEKEAYERPARLHRFMQSVSFSDESNGNISPVIFAANQNNKNKENKKVSKKDEISVSWERGGCNFSSKLAEENEIETETLLFSSRSFSYDSSYDFCHPAMDSITKNTDNGSKKTCNMKIRTLKRQVSKNWKLSPEITSPMRASVLRRMVSCTADGKVKESVAVVKKSEDPYQDFKRSMLEMILEKQMFEAKDLEELLQCFLSLNSRQYHGVIAEAFSEIWEILFCDSPAKKRNSMRIS